MSNAIRAKADNVYIQYRINRFDKDVAKDILKQLGFMVIEYNYVLNEEPVKSLIEKLSLNDEIKRSNGFTYVDGRHRLVFINEDLSESEQTIVFAHELGHIICDHLSHQNVIGKDVQEEYEANEFAHFLLEDSLRRRIFRFVVYHRLLFCLVLLSSIFIITLSVVIGHHYYEEANYYGNYYVTDSGQKYHRKECIFVKDKNNVHRLTKKEFDSGIYEPCQICLP